MRGRQNEKGFTLIELLVVVAILGVLAVVVVPNVGKFIGKGVVEAANTELHDAQTALVAYMADNNMVDVDGTLGVPDGDLNETVGEFLLGVERMQARYVVEDGEVTGAVALEDGRWKDLDFVDGAWVKAEQET